jgi:D-serine deaminase-like pyridoxal phosphate-dependent protein
MKLTIPDGRVDWRTKGVRQPGPGVSDEEFAAAGHFLFGGMFSWPVMVARRSALDHNIAALADFCARQGVELAPHGKTTMAPALFEEQLNSGAWGITAATAGQLLAYRAFGVPRAMLANELLDPDALRWLAGEVELGWEVLCFVDSVAGVEAMSLAAGSLAVGSLAAGSPAAGSRPVRVLAELGYPGGRTGCRDAAELTQVARAAAAAPGVELAGVAAYEGGLAAMTEVTEFLDAVRHATMALAQEGLLPGEVVVTAGGSAFFDVVAERLAGDWLPGHRVQGILRSGAYVSHDDGLYRGRTPFNRVPGTLDAALEVWAQVISVPEPGLAIVGMGKRDAPYDAGLPVPLRVRRADGQAYPRRHGAEGLSVTRFNDHHAFLSVPPDVRLVPGDLICLGISHPCTAFDKWQVIPVVDDDYLVTDLIRTYF